MPACRSWEARFAALVLLAACHGREPQADSRFAEVQARGQVAMGVDQYT
ncbi:MAG: hypothetical protein ACHQ2E_06620 [Gemmatimonadales bacterium]